MSQPTAIAFSVFVLDSLPLPATGRVTYKDIRFPALSLYVSSTGAKTFFVRKRVKRRDERLIIGRYPEIKIEQARARAAVFCGIIADRKDPLEVERKEKLDTLTLGEHFEAYMERYSKLHKLSWKYDAYEIPLYLSHWFKRRLSDITRDDVRRLHEKLGRENGKVQANKVVTRLSALYNKAIQWDWPGTNPTLGMQRFKEKSRDRFIQPAELPYFHKALAAEENETLRDYIMMLLLTGARKTNMLKMRWDQVNWELKEWKIPETKNGEPLIVPLVSQAVELLERRRKARQGPWVFAQDADPSKHACNPIKAWKRTLAVATLAIWLDDELASGWVKVQNKKLLSYLSPTLKVQRLLKLAEKQSIELTCGLMDIRLHDLRRTFGSYQALGGESLQVIGMSLGHKSLRSTQIYARLNVQAIRKATGKAVNAILQISDHLAE